MARYRQDTENEGSVMSWKRKHGRGRIIFCW